MKVEPEAMSDDKVAVVFTSKRLIYFRFHLSLLRSHEVAITRFTPRLRRASQAGKKMTPRPRLPPRTSPHEGAMTTTMITKKQGSGFRRHDCPFRRFSPDPAEKGGGIVRDQQLEKMDLPRHGGMVRRRRKKRIKRNEKI